MPHFSLPSLTAVVAAALSATAAAVAAPKKAALIAPATRVAPIVYRERTLANGLRVLSARDKANPTVAIQVWYHVGSKDDPRKRSGFAHLFEHLLFKSTKNMKSEMMDRLTEDVGGENNAYTQDDVTVYHETVPSNYLETLLWAEADRMGSLTVDEANFKSERSVVEEEYRQSVLAPPYGRLGVLIDERSFLVHPYKRSTIGKIEDLEAASLENVRAFHNTFYRPDNATLVVVGDFEQAQLDGWVDKYFGRVPRPDAPLPRVSLREPARTQARRYVEHGPNVPLPAVAITFLAPTAASEDAFALQVGETILSGGESSRLHQALVYQQQIAQEAYAYGSLREQSGLFVLGATLASGKKPEQAERALLAELKKIQEQPVSAAELAKAKNQLLASALGQRETSNGKADALGEAAVLLGNPARVNTDIARLQAVSASDVRRVMTKYFAGPSAKPVVLYYLAAETKKNPAPKTITKGASAR